MKHIWKHRVCTALLALTLLLTGCSAAVPSASPNMEAAQPSGKIPDTVSAPAETAPSPDEAASAAEEMPPMRQLEVDYNARAHAAEAAEAAGGEAAPAEAETQPADPSCRSLPLRKRALPTKRPPHRTVSSWSSTPATS